MAARVWLWKYQLVCLGPVTAWDTTSCPWVRLELSPHGLEPLHVSPPLARTYREKRERRRRAGNHKLCSCEAQLPGNAFSQHRPCRTAAIKLSRFPTRLSHFSAFSSRSAGEQTHFLTRDLVTKWGHVNIPPSLEQSPWNNHPFQKYEGCLSLLLEIHFLLSNTILANMLPVSGVQIY